MTKPKVTERRLTILQHLAERPGVIIQDVQWNKDGLVYIFSDSSMLVLARPSTTSPEGLRFFNKMAEKAVSASE